MGVGKCNGIALVVIPAFDIDVHISIAVSEFLIPLKECAPRVNPGQHGPDEWSFGDTSALASRRVCRNFDNMRGALTAIKIGVIHPPIDDSIRQYYRFIIGLVTRSH